MWIIQSNGIVDNPAKMDVNIRPRVGRMTQRPVFAFPGADQRNPVDYLPGFDFC